MFLPPTKKLMDQLATLENSTTLLLESLSGLTLRLTIDSQAEMKESDEEIIRRVVKLYFESADMPVLYCISRLRKNTLKAQEYEMLSRCIEPIGKVFQHFNNPNLISKRNISVVKNVSTELAKQLNVKSSVVFEKKYDYWVDDRAIGCIQEFFNEESLERI